MPGDGLPEEAAEAYEAALEEAGLEDVRPLYRGLLKRLRDRDPGAYERAVRRYEEELLPKVARGVDPLAAWLRYGAWLAGQVEEGRTVVVDATGKSADFEGEPAPGGLVLHLPDEQRERGMVLAAPREPSDHQAETRELLCG